MKKTLPALLTHVILILALIIGIGVLGIIATGMDAEGNEKFFNIQVIAVLRPQAGLRCPPAGALQRGDKAVPVPAALPEGPGEPSFQHFPGKLRAGQQAVAKVGLDFQCHRAASSGDEKSPPPPKLGRKANPSAVPPAFAPEADMTRTQRPVTAGTPSPSQGPLPGEQAARTGAALSR